MLFNSLSFAVFFPIVCIIFFVIPKRFRCVWLLVVSYYFYMNWSAVYALLIALSTVSTYATALWIDRYKKCRNIALGMCITVNLAILFYFKYLMFFLSTVNVLLERFGHSINTDFSIILPVGISFYTFQAIGYIIDVYRGEVKAEKNFVRYALFVSFFPQLVAGPIERSKNLLRQISLLGDANSNRWEWNRIKHGLIYMLYGFFLKMVLADQLALLVDYGYYNMAFLGGVELTITAIAFSLQIYCDFYSYSVIAIGAAQVLGFTLMENFNAPYFSISIKEFWRRWHISLSTWFKDYLYIPLGGSRVGKVKRIRNLFIIFLLSGLWHGANWTYVFWGVIHALYQFVGEMLSPVRKRIGAILEFRDDSQVYYLFKVVGTFLLTTLAWIFFRADNLKEAMLFIKKIVFQWNPWVLFDGSLAESIFSVSVVWLALVVGLLILMAFDLILYRNHLRMDEYVCSQGVFLQNVIVVFFIIMILIFGVYGDGVDAKEFVYFQF